MIFTHEYHFYAQLGYKSEMMYRIVGKMVQISIYFECSLRIRKYKLRNLNGTGSCSKCSSRCLQCFCIATLQRLWSGVTFLIPMNVWRHATIESLELIIIPTITLTVYQHGKLVAITTTVTLCSVSDFCVLKKSRLAKHHIYSIIAIQ